MTPRTLCSRTIGTEPRQGFLAASCGPHGRLSRLAGSGRLGRAATERGPPGPPLKDLPATPHRFSSAANSPHGLVGASIGWGQDPSTGPHAQIRHQLGEHAGGSRPARTVPAQTGVHDVVSTGAFHPSASPTFETCGMRYAQDTGISNRDRSRRRRPVLRTPRNSASGASGGFLTFRP